MAGKRSQHVMPKGSKWSVRRTGSSRASGIFGTQKEAVEKAKELARAEGGDVYIHGRDGRIHDRRDAARLKA